jgi:hypothetical protein
MRPHSSSTSSSEPEESDQKRGAPAPGGLRDALVVAAWTLLFLAALDVAVNLAFRPPDDPRIKPTSQFVSYFNFGWSIESKLRRAVGPSDESTAPLMKAGWVETDVELARHIPEPPEGSLVVSCYGMSFSNQIATLLPEFEPTVHLRLFGGPSAPANHSYATYQLDKGRSSQVVILGVLSSSVASLLTNTGMTWQFEAPAPYTYPRYILREEGLNAEWPMVRSLADLRRTLADDSAWAAFRDQVRQSDAFYNAFLFRGNLSDRSVLVRMLRRAVAQRWQASQTALVHGPDGFVESSPAVAELREIVSAFAASVRRDGKTPVVLLIENQGYRDHLYRTLASVGNKFHLSARTRSARTPTGPTSCQTAISPRKPIERSRGFFWGSSAAS